MNSYLAERARVVALIAELALQGTGWYFLPNPLEILAQISTYEQLFIKITAEHSGTAAISEEIERLPGEIFSRLASSQAETECVAMFAEGMELLYRRLYTTDQEFLGVGSSGMQPGDEVWVLRGARIPFILCRREGGSTRGFT